MISDILKKPLQYSAEQLLGDCIPSNINPDSKLKKIMKRVEAIALQVIFAIVAVASIPLWLMGDIMEFCIVGNKPFDDTVVLPDIPLDKLHLDPEKTKFLNMPHSTFQSTSDPTYCANSDWGVFNQKHFNAEKGTEHLAQGQGVDLLTQEGIQKICEKTKLAGANSIRLSIEQADIETAPGQFNDVAMQRYVETIKYIKEQGLIPIVVFNHFVCPIDESGHNIFEKPSSVQRFTDYVKYCYPKLKDHVEHFFTFNEPMTVANCNYILGKYPAQQILNMMQRKEVMNNLLDAHKCAYHALHEMAKEHEKEIHVGLTHQVLNFIPSSRWNFIARIVAFVMTYFFHSSFMKWAKKNQDTIDWFGVQYYTRPYIGGFPPDSTCKPGEKMVESMRFRFDPKGILPAIREVNQCFEGKKPLFATEYGTAGVNNIKQADEMDERRAEYLVPSFTAQKVAQDEGAPLIGSGAWGDYGNQEWEFGFSKQHDFGNIARDPKTGLERITKGFEVISIVFNRTKEMMKQLLQLQKAA